MKLILFVFTLLLLGCSKPQRSPEEMQRYIEQLQQSYSPDSVQTVSIDSSIKSSAIVATFNAKFMKKNQLFYPKELRFEFERLIKGNHITVSGQDCSIVYTIVGTPMTTDNSAKFTAYTDFDQWFSGEEIQRVPCAVYFKEDVYQVTMGNRNFYAEVPPISAASPDTVYRVKKGDTPTSIARKYNVSITCLSKSVNLQVGEQIKIKCQ